jgi:hypothetical protein
MKPSFLIIISLWFISQTLAFAQTTIIDLKTKQPIPFVQVLNLRAKAGVLSDENGIFTLPNVEKNDTIVFSCIGYETKKIVAQNIDKQVFMSPKALVLSEAIVRPTRTDKVFINKNKKSADSGAGSGEGKPGFEIGRLIYTDCRGCRATKLSLYLGRKCTRGAKARLHIYDYNSEKDCPGKELLQRSIYIISTGQNQWIDIDLSSQQIILENDKIIIGVEMLSNNDNMVFGLTNYADSENKGFLKSLGSYWIDHDFMKDKKGKRCYLMVKLELN